MIAIRLGEKQDLDWAQATVEVHHYLKKRVDNRARPMAYIITLNNWDKVGLVMVGIPHATRCNGWWGYPGLITQWQVVDLCRIWLDPRVQLGGELAKPGLIPGFIDRQGLFRQTVASWAINQVLARVQVDRVSLWPPVYLDQPYHIRLVVSYHDPRFHTGYIYQVANALPMYTRGGKPHPGPAGKFGWCWTLPEPSWKWNDIEIIKPRTIRMVFT